MYEYSIGDMKKSQAVTRLQRFFREKRARQMHHRRLTEEWLRTCTFPANQFQVVNGHWLQIQLVIQALVESVAIAISQELKPILDTETVLGPGAHAAITMNEISNLPSPFSQKAEALEIIDSVGNHALVRVWLIQLGAKPVIRSSPNGRYGCNNIHQYQDLCKFG